MSQQQYVIPERCINCGAVFDLWYDLLNREGSGAKAMLRYSNDEFLCWRCRELNKEEPLEYAEEDGSGDQI